MIKNNSNIDKSSSLERGNFENQFTTLIQPRVEYIHVSVADSHPQERVGGKQGHARRKNTGGHEGPTKGQRNSSNPY